MGPIDMLTPDGKRLTSNILGLGYYDSSTGQAVLVAQIKDSYGQLISDIKSFLQTLLTV